MKNTAFDRKKNLRGVSTLDLIKKNVKMLFLLLVLTTFDGSPIYGGHSTLDLVDPGFNPEIETNSYGVKVVHDVRVQPDGKILAFGFFSSYNRLPVGNLVRLNADGSLDPTFNDQGITTDIASGGEGKILLQPDGKIILTAPNIVVGGQTPRILLRLNADGSIDSTFSYPLKTSGLIAIDSLGRIYLGRGSFQTPQGMRRIIRLNEDGSIDTSFNFTLSSGDIGFIKAQGNRLIVGGGNFRIFRLNEDGSEDMSFTPLITAGRTLSNMTVQPDNKILYMIDRIRRLNENGSTDEGFQPILLTGINSRYFGVAGDGKIIIRIGGSTSTFRRYLPNGADDPSFNPYTHPACKTFTIQPDGSVLIADESNLNNSTIGINNFVRLTPVGTPDPTFNPGGVGFQNILPGSIRALETQPDRKILLGGKFDVINDIYRPKIARLNADSTVDESFVVNTSGNGNYFSLINNIYQIRAQSDGKIFVSGSFNYVLNGVTKQNLVRLNSDGSIDATFNLTETINDFSVIVGAGRNRFSILSDGKLVVGTSKLNGFGLAPLKLTAGGDRDTSFNPTINSQSANIFIDDVTIQPDGKILISGSHRPAGGSFNSFVARLDVDGSTDTTFVYSEEPNRLKATLALLPNGKILVGKHSDGSLPGRVERLKADGSLDASFNSLSIPGGVINALLSLPNGKIFVGGKFTVSVNGQQTRNLLRMGADGNLESTIYNLNEEVLALAADAEGRVLVGGGFTLIDTNGSMVEPRTYVARLIDAPRFDFDGDGRSDISAFSVADGVWKILGSRNNQSVSTRFGSSGDKTTAADFDGDGRADIAVFRPSDGIWYLLRSRDGFTAHHWGTGGDMPVAGDYDGDGRADLSVFRPSNGAWYIQQSSNLQPVILNFGLTGDIPLPEVDFDGDGKTDIAAWRPADGHFYWLASGAANQFRAVHFGTFGDIPSAADYNGDGRTDLAVYRPANGNWYQYLSDTADGYTFTAVHFGLNNDTPVPADYDGDGKTDIAVRRENIWHILRSKEGYAAFTFAEASDTAIAAMLKP